MKILTRQIIKGKASKFYIGTKEATEKEFEKQMESSEIVQSFSEKIGDNLYFRYYLDSK